MTNIEEIVSLVKNNPNIFPYLKEINGNIDLVMHLYNEKIDITRHLSEDFKKNKIIIDLSINLNPLNILNFNLNYLSTNQIFNAIEKNNKLIQFLNLTDFKKDKIKKSIENLYEFDYSTIKNDIFFIKDKNFMENALNKSPFNVIYFKTALDKEEYMQLFLKMIGRNYEVFKVLNNELVENEDYLIKVLQTNPEAYILFPNHKRNSKQIKEYVFKDGIKDTFRYLTYNEKTEEAIYNYLDVADIIEKNTVFVDEDNHSKLFEDKKILLKLILNSCVSVGNIENLEWANEKEILKILHNNGNFFTKLSKKQKENFLLIKAATLESNICCEEFFDNFNKYPEVVEAVVEKNIENYDKINNEYKENKSWIVKYLKINPIERFKKIPDMALRDIENLFFLVSIYPELLELMDKEFRNNKYNVLRFIDENPDTFKFMDYSLKSDMEIADYAISKDITNISSIGIELYDERLIINNFFKRIINGEKYCEDRALFILFFKDVLDTKLFIKALESQGSLYEGLAIHFDEKKYLIAALKGGFKGMLNPIMKIDSDLLYILLKYHPEPIGALNSDFFLTEEDMIIKVLGENPFLFEKQFFFEYKINLSFAEKLISINPENIIYIMDKYFLREEIKDMSLIDKVIIENPKNFSLITKILEQIEGIYLLNKETISYILDCYILKKINKKSLYFLYKIPEILRNDLIFKRKYEKIFGEKINFVNELLFKLNLIKSNNIYPFVTERFEAIITENKEKEEETKKLEELFHLRNFVDKVFLIDFLRNSKVHRQISEKYYKNTKELLGTIYYLKDKKSMSFNSDLILKNKILEYVEDAEIIKEDFIEYIGILYLEYFQFKEKDIVKLYGYRDKREKEAFVKEKILKNDNLCKNIDELNRFIISSIFVGNNHNLLNNYFDNDFKVLIVDGKTYDIKKWRIYKTEKDDTTLPLRKVISLLFDKGKLDYIDIDSFYKNDKTRNEKTKNDLIYTHRKKIENQISPDLEAVVGWKITILSENNKPRKFSLILEK